MPTRKNVPTQRAPKSKEKRSKLQIDADRARIAEFLLRGYSQKQIAQDLELTEVMVSRDVAAIEQRWKNSPLIDFNEAKRRELARLDMVERMAFEAWEASKEDEKTTVQSGGEGRGQAVSITKKSRTGSEAYLRVIIQCVEQRCKILGLHKEVLEHTGKDGQPIEVRTSVDGMKDLFQAMRRRERDGRAGES